MLERRTVRKPVIFSGDSPDTNLLRLCRKSWITKPTITKVLPAEQEGIVFRFANNGKTEIPLDIEHLYSEKSWYGARYCFLSEHPDSVFTNDHPKNKAHKIYITEHLVAALGKAGITDATIEVTPTQFDKRKSFIPICGPGIITFYKQLVASTKKISGEPEGFIVADYDRYEIEDHKGIHTIKIKPTTKQRLEIKIVNSDLGSIRIGSDPVILTNTVKDMHIDARPVARLETKPKEFALKTLNKIGFKGVSPETYIMPRVGATESEVIGLMHPQYQEGANEHIWHGVIDRFSELYSIGGVPVFGNISYKNANHLYGVDAIKYFVRNNTIRKVN